jgi:hypothetical protein
MNLNKLLIATSIVSLTALINHASASNDDFMDAPVYPNYQIDEVELSPEARRLAQEAEIARLEEQLRLQRIAELQAQLAPVQEDVETINHVQDETVEDGETAFERDTRRTEQFLEQTAQVTTNVITHDVPKAVDQTVQKATNSFNKREKKVGQYFRKKRN